MALEPDVLLLLHKVTINIWIRFSLIIWTSVDVSWQKHIFFIVRIFFFY